MFDRYNRKIDYLRISVTDKCNLRCTYCMPREGVTLVRHEDMLSLEEIADVARTAVALGVTKVRLTGGEPLVRRNIVHLVSMLAAIEGIKDFAMTTNGTLLSGFAEPLVAAGLGRINISLDTLNPHRYAEITRGGDVQRVLEGIEAARRAGLSPVKLNCVIKETPEEADAQTVAAYGRTNGLEVRYIRRMNLAEGHFSVVVGGTGGDCLQCNRLRLSCTGLIRPCLFNDLSFDVRELGAEEAIRRAVDAKPSAGDKSSAAFHTIGG